MARSNIQRRQDAERDRIEAYRETLQRVSPVARPAPDFATAIEEARKGFADRIIRDASDWRPRLKTRDATRLRLAAARHLFARYAVPASLEAIWVETDGLAGQEVMLRKSWYIFAASGVSLYKADARKWLSRKEVHHFLNPPGNLGFEEAWWQAVARTYTDDIGLALRIARSKIARSARDDLHFWREVTQFFCANPATLAEIDDLCDFLAAMHARDRGFGLKGRSLVSLTRQMHAWHRDLAAIERIEAARRLAARRHRTVAAPSSPSGGRWAGSSLADWTWTPTAKEAKARREDYVVMQLNSATDLVAESSAMRHCVSSYAAKCISGNASIWSLRRRMPGKVERLLTIELDRKNRAVQVRGFANRLVHPDEAGILARWAKARGVVL